MICIVVFPISQIEIYIKHWFKYIWFYWIIIPIFVAWYYICKKLFHIFSAPPNGCKSWNWNDPKQCIECSIGWLWQNGMCVKKCDPKFYINEERQMCLGKVHIHLSLTRKSHFHNWRPPSLTKCVNPDYI